MISFLLSIVSAINLYFNRYFTGIICKIYVSGITISEMIRAFVTVMGVSSRPVYLRKVDLQLNLIILIIESLWLKIIWKYTFV